MPGLSQLQKLNADLLSLGDEEKIRALRGEKPVTYKIPRSVPDKDDSDDFKFGMPEITEEDLAQSEAAEAERLREANDFSDITGESKTETAAQPKKVEKEVAPDFSELLPSAADLSADDLDLSDFETPEEEVPEEPEEVAIEDMDLDSLLALSEPEEEAEEIEDIPAEEVIESEPEPEPVKEEPKVEELLSSDDPLQKIDMSLFKEESPAENANDNSSIPKEMQDFLADADTLTETSPAADTTEIKTEPESELAEEIPQSDVSDEVSELEEIAEAEPLEELQSEAVKSAEPVEKQNEEAQTDYSYNDLNADFEDTNEAGDENKAIDMNEGIPLEFNEIPDVISSDDIEKKAPVKVEKKEEDTQNLEGFDIPDLDMDFEEESTEVPVSQEATVSPEAADDVTNIEDIENIENIGEEEPLSVDEEIADTEETNAAGGEEINNLDLDSISEMDFSSTEKSAGSEGESGFNLDDIQDNAFDGAEENARDFDLDSDSNGTGTEGANPLDQMGDFSSVDDFDISGDAETPSPDTDVPESEFSFNTDNIENLDFSNNDSSQDFEMGDISGMGDEGDDDAFNIPGFSDTTTANIYAKKKVDTPNFANAAKDTEKKEKNTFTDSEYERFTKNLEEYPLNVRKAVEDLVRRNELTDDALFEILEKVLRKVPARQLASKLEKILDIQLDVPRDFERRSAKEYEAYKKTVEYHLKNKIIPGAILSVAAAIMVFCLYTLTNTFVYKPAKANYLYKQGLTLIQENQYPLSEQRFNEALTYKPVKKWFYTYAEEYREHKQYGRARMMYNAILERFNHEKEAGLTLADMEANELFNYEEAERVLKREVLDYHINDSTAMLKLGDMYLDWGTDVDSSKLALAKQQYDLLEQLYGATNEILSREMRYFIRTDNLRQVLMYKELFYPQKKALAGSDVTELSGYLLEKRYGPLKFSEEELRPQIEDLKSLLDRSVKLDKENPYAYYNFGKYFIEIGTRDVTKGEAKNERYSILFLNHAIELFENQKTRKKRDLYKYIDTYRLLGDEYYDEKEYLLSEENYVKGINLFENEKEVSGFESNENIGLLYSRLADLDFFISTDNDAALRNYINAIKNKYDTSKVRYRIGYIQYQNEKYLEALGSFNVCHETNNSDTHLLLALANTLTKRDDLDAARGYYQKLIGELNVEREKYRKLYGPYIANERQKEVADLYMKATNNLGVILSEIASKKGDSSLNAKAIVNLQESVVSWDAINRDKKTMIRAQTSNLAEQNIKYIINPISEYKPQIYSEIKRLMQGEKVSN